MEANFNQITNAELMRVRTIRRHFSFFDAANRDWEKTWQMKLTPWDLKGTVTPPLVDVIQRGVVDPKGKRALVPGCGTGYDCRFLRESGFDEVHGLDLSPTAIAAALTFLQQQPVNGVDFFVADFFKFETNNKYDFIFDYLFFAALDPPLRESWAKSMQRLLMPKRGVLATLIFPLKQRHEDASKGPPYPVLLEDYEDVLKPLKFECTNIEEVLHHFMRPVHNCFQ